MNGSSTSYPPPSTNKALRYTYKKELAAIQSPMLMCYLINHNRQYSTLLFGPRREKTCLRGFANNKGTDQPAHPRSLISVFVFRFLESIIPNLATSEISIF